MIGLVHRSRTGRLSLAVTAAVLILSASAEAATVAVFNPFQATYRAGGGETNDLTYGFGDRTFTDVGAPLTAGTGCTQASANAANCQGSFHIDAYLREGDDRANFTAGGRANAWAGAGHDTVSVDSTSQSAAAYGEAGNDDITVGGEFNQTGDGGPGNDSIKIRGYYGQATAIGAGGTDLIDFKLNGPFNAVQARLDGGDADDTIVAQPPGRASTADGGPGNDIIVLYGVPPSFSPSGAFTVTGGAGNDTLIGGRFDDTIDAGEGRDFIDVLDGGADKVTCGAGADVVRFDASDSIADDCEIPLPAPPSP